MIPFALRFFIACLVSLTLVVSASANELRLAVTTSFDNSGLAEILVPALEADTDLTLNLVVVGTGRALRLGESGDVDSILVHSPDAERAFVESGYATHRREIMYNDFVLVGPSSDPAEIRLSSSVLDALSRIASHDDVRFVSRGDDSGTHKKEVFLWGEAGLPPDQFGEWYLETGSGMGRALNTASALGGYILTDRGSWLNFGNPGDLVLLYEGDSRLQNVYSFLPIDSTRHPHIRSDLNRRLESWLTGIRGQELIGSYRIRGERVFVPSAD